MCGAWASGSPRVSVTERTGLFPSFWTLSVELTLFNFQHFQCGDLQSDLAAYVPITGLGGWVSKFSLWSLQGCIWPNESAIFRQSSVACPVSPLPHYSFRHRYQYCRYQELDDLNWVRNMIRLFSIATWNFAHFDLASIDESIDLVIENRRLQN